MAIGRSAQAADAIIAAVDSATPPPRLLLGADAIGYWEQKRDAPTVELAAWREVGENTTFDAAVAA